MATPDLAQCTPPTRLRTLRVVSVAAAVTAAIAHIPPTPIHLREIPYVGLGFVVLTALCLSVALILAMPPLRVAWRPAWSVAAGSCTLAIVAYVASRSVGLPGMSDDIGNWADPLGLVSVGSEAIVVLTAILGLTRATRPDRTGVSQGPRATSLPEWSLKSDRRTLSLHPLRPSPTKEGTLDSGDRVS